MALLSRLGMLPDSPNQLPEIETVDQLEHLVGILTETKPIELSQIKKKLIEKFRIVLNPGRLGFIKLSHIFEGNKFILIKNKNTVFVKSSNRATCGA
jgi:hypothetical protein